MGQPVGVRVPPSALGKQKRVDSNSYQRAFSFADSRWPLPIASLLRRRRQRMANLPVIQPHGSIGKPDHHRAVRGFNLKDFPRFERQLVEFRPSCAIPNRQHRREWIRDGSCQACVCVHLSLFNHLKSGHGARIVSELIRPFYLLVTVSRSHR